MKQTLSTSQAAHLLTGDEYSSWTYSAAHALCEYLEEVEDDTGEEIEFCPVAIRCDYTEYSSLREWAEDYFSDWHTALDIDDEDDDTIDSMIREHIQEYGHLIEFDGGVIVSAF